MSRLLPLLDEIVQASRASRAHHLRTGLCPVAAADPSELDLLEPSMHVSVAWAGSDDLRVLRRLVLAHTTAERLSEQVGIYPEKVEVAPGTESRVASAA